MWGAVEEIIFVGRKEGKAITSAAVWKGLKNIAKELDIAEETVFPHSLRHLFAKNYMEKVGDITELADILGHSRLETTWIYTKTSSAEKRKRLGLLDLWVDIIRHYIDFSICHVHSYYVKHNNRNMFQHSLFVNVSKKVQSLFTNLLKLPTPQMGFSPWKLNNTGNKILN